MGRAQCVSYNVPVCDVVAVTSLILCALVSFCRLQGEAKVTQLIRRVQEYLESKYGDSEPELLCRIYMRRIDHLYYKVGERAWTNGRG